jgi:hypothetical protein
MRYDYGGTAIRALPVAGLFFLAGFGRDLWLSTSFSLYRVFLTSPNSSESSILANKAIQYLLNATKSRARNESDSVQT